MPITYTIDDKAGVIILTLRGQLAVTEITEYLETSRNDPAFRTTLHRLVVVDESAVFPASSAVRDITTQTRGERPNPGVRIAAVATTPLARGMVAMFFGYWGLSDSYQLFDDVPSAMKWLTEH